MIPRMPLHRLTHLLPDWPESFTWAIKGSTWSGWNVLGIRCRRALSSLPKYFAAGRLLKAIPRRNKISKIKLSITYPLWKNRPVRSSGTLKIPCSCRCAAGRRYPSPVWWTRCWMSAIMKKLRKALPKRQAMPGLPGIIIVAFYSATACLLVWNEMILMRLSARPSNVWEFR